MIDPYSLIGYWCPYFFLATNLSDLSVLCLVVSGQPWSCEGWCTMAGIGLGTQWLRR